MVKIFQKELPADCEKAIRELINFSDVWWKVQHECDMYEEKQDSNELTYQSYVGAKNWLSKWEKLYIKYNDK